MINNLEKEEKAYKDIPVSFIDQTSRREILGPERFDVGFLNEKR